MELILLLSSNAIFLFIILVFLISIPKKEKDVPRKQVSADLLKIKEQITRESEE